MPDAIYRPSHIGLLKFGPEAAALAHSATALDAAPALTPIGYGGIPNIPINEGTQIVDAVGTPYGVDEVYGDRDISFKVSLKLGNLEFLKYLYRDSGVGGASAYGLPLLALAGGASNNYAGKGFTWLCRKCLCNSFTLRFAEGSGQPIMLEADFLALALDENGAPLTTSDEELISAGGRVLTWAHSDALVGTTSYRDLFGAITVQVNNNVKPDGRRPDLGVTNPLSRVPYELIPHDNKITSQFTLKDKLPAAMRGRFNDLYLNASNAASGATGGDVKSVSVHLGTSMISNQTMNQTEVGSPFGFSSSQVNRYFGVTTSGSEPEPDED